MSGTGLGRRALLAGAAAGLVSPRARAFGDEGAFHPRVLLTGTSRLEGPRSRAPARWAEDLRRQTSAPSRTAPGTVRADAPQLMAEPFAVWAGDGPVAALTSRELEGLRKFLLVGGILFVDDAAPEAGAFGRDARRELLRVLPEAAVIKLPEKHVVYHSFYLLSRPVGRVEGPDHLDAISLGGTAQVLFSSHDVLGALARERDGVPAFRVEPGGDRQRELATRLAVNIAMYVLCSNYKDDQVHAPMLMKRRAPK